MKFTLAMVLIVFAIRGAGAAQGQQSSQPPPPLVEAPQPGIAGAAPQQPTTPPPTSQPCVPGKDTCAVSEPAKQEPASAPAAKAQDQSGKVAAKVTRSRKTKARRDNPAKEQPVAHVESTTKKTVVRKGSTSDPTAVLTPGATTETNYSRQTTADLLAATDANLKQAKSRSLNPNQVETVNQIQLFVERAHAAMKEGDLDRGHNLALKANLLSDDLVKH